MGRGFRVTVIDGASEADPATQVVATAVSARRTVLVEVNGLGFVSAVRLLSPVVRTWDSTTIDERVRAVAGVAHDRYRANLNRNAGDDELLAIAARERQLNF